MEGKKTLLPHILLLSIERITESGRVDDGQVQGHAVLLELVGGRVNPLYRDRQHKSNANKEAAAAAEEENS